MNGEKGKKILDQHFEKNYDDYKDVLKKHDMAFYWFLKDNLKVEENSQRINGKNRTQTVRNSKLTGEITFVLNPISEDNELIKKCLNEAIESNKRDDGNNKSKLEIIDEDETKFIEMVEGFEILNEKKILGANLGKIQVQKFMDNIPQGNPAGFNFYPDNQAIHPYSINQLDIEEKNIGNQAISKPQAKGFDYPQE